MFAEFDTRHVPHFHASYGEFEASFAIDSARLLAGTMPRRQMRLIVHWAEIHRTELEENWRELQSGGRRIPIDPLS